jgi:cbb3-type cytochrome oxidase subunit 3
MLRYIKNHMASMEGVDVYPIISLLIFFTFFSIVLWYALKAPNRMMEENQNLPFDDSSMDNTNQ